MPDVPSSPYALATTDRWLRSRAFIQQRLYRVMHASECSCHPSSGAPTEMMDSTSMDTRPLRRR